MYVHVAKDEKLKIGNWKKTGFPGVGGRRNCKKMRKKRVFCPTGREREREG